MPPLMIALFVFAWAFCGLLAYLMEFAFWKQLWKLEYERHIFKKDHFLRIRNISIRLFPTFRVATIYRSGDAEIHRRVVTKALTAAILGPIGYADAYYACWQMKSKSPAIWGKGLAGLFDGFTEALRSKYRNPK
ncbi:MAG: hypothetical protein G01um101419_650 [Parcubacteria group bacterium Gr01-1014_19]|nr:MAG: hypothetical protein G01um101419_650 [Parcubacteria group bacterium Gr01-1014_19]